MDPAADPLMPASLADDLDLIADMTADFARSRDIEESLRLGLTHIATRMQAEAASLFLMDAQTGDLVCHACWGPADVTGLRLADGQGIVWRAVRDNRPQLVQDAEHDPDFTRRVDGHSGFVTRSVLCAPLTVRGERLGAIELFNRRGGTSFDEDDRRVLQALAASAALALISARQAEAMAQQQALQRELALAAGIQRAMLPKPRPAGFPIHGVNVAARGVSGDFFDVVALADGRLAFTIADVSGKGMNAAMLMSKTASLFRCLAKRLSGPGELLAAIDAELAETGSAGMFVTMVAGILAPDLGRVVLANAGHDDPVLIQGARVSRVTGGMPPLGVDPALFRDGCPEQVVYLDGGALYLFTDGLTEARDDQGGMLGTGGLVDLLMAQSRLPARRRLARVVAEVAASEPGPRDDLTLLVAEDRRLPLISVLDQCFAARPDQLCEIRAAIAAALAPVLDYAGELVDDVVLAVDEACQNVIRHAYCGQAGDIVIALAHTPGIGQDKGGWVVADVRDFAPAVDPACICPRSLDDVRPGGLGTHLMRSVMDHVDFLPCPQDLGNWLRMARRVGKA